VIVAFFVGFIHFVATNARITSVWQGCDFGNCAPTWRIAWFAFSRITILLGQLVENACNSNAIVDNLTFYLSKYTATRLRTFSSTNINRVLNIILQKIASLFFNYQILWTLLLCTVNSAFLLNFFSQTVHWKLPAWRVICLLKL